jgi:hypothetical protein
MTSKDLTMTIVTEGEGITMTLKTVSVLGKGNVSVQAEPGVYNIDELIKALEEVRSFGG